MSLGVTQLIDVNVSSTPIANAFGASTKLVRLSATEGCHFSVGVTPVAIITDAILPADIVEVIGVKPGEKIACIQLIGGAAAGALTVTEAE